VDNDALYRSVEFYDDFNKLTINFVSFGGTTVPRVGELVHLPGQGTRDGSGAYRVVKVEYYFLPDDTKEQRDFRAAQLGKIMIHVERILLGVRFPTRRTNASALARRALDSPRIGKRRTQKEASARRVRPAPRNQVRAQRQ